MKIISNLFILCAMLIFSSCTTKNLNRVDAERSLKVLNSDIINFETKLAESADFKILETLTKQPDAPFPFQKNLNGFVRVKEFDFDKTRGEYYRNNELGTFQKTGDSEQIIIHFSEKEFENFAFIITSYKSEIISSNENFPIQFTAEIHKNGQRIWALDYHSKISDLLPESIYLNITGSEYHLQADLNRTRDGENGTLDFSLTFDYLLKRLIETQFRSTIVYSRQGYYFNKIELKQNIFDHKLSGYLNYSDVDPGAEDYAGSFNSNSLFDLTETGKGKLGQVVLAKVKDKDLLDFHIKFTNGEEELLSFFIPQIDKLLNFKY